MQQFIDTYVLAILSINDTLFLFVFSKFFIAMRKYPDDDALIGWVAVNIVCNPDHVFFETLYSVYVYKQFQPLVCTQNNKTLQTMLVLYKMLILIDLELSDQGRMVLLLILEINFTNKSPADVEIQLMQVTYFLNITT